MSNEYNNNSIEHLFRLSGPTALDDGASVLEAANASPDPESLMPRVSLSDEELPVVERTISKILENGELDDEENFALEAIIIPDKRPAIDVIEGNHFETDHHLWAHLNRSNPDEIVEGEPYQMIKSALPAVGRIDLPDHPSVPFAGTGFIVGQGLLMTNRHVAEAFSSGVGVKQLRFQSGASAILDFEQRIDGGSSALDIAKVLMIHPYWDMALLLVDGIPDSIEPLKLSIDPPPLNNESVVIGYPAFDWRNDRAVQDRIFRGRYNIKRVLPGLLTGKRRVQSFGQSVDSSAYDYSTLGGNSGSCVIDLRNGEVSALHFGGRYLESNYAVPAHDMARDGRIIDMDVGFAGNPTRADGPWNRAWSIEERPIVSSSSSVAKSSRLRGASIVSPQRANSMTIPIKVTVEVGDISPATEPKRPLPNQHPNLDLDDDLLLNLTEAVPSDYADRQGYDEEFLGIPIPIPEVVCETENILEFELDGETETVLRYQHFSVLMNARRRMCYFSAANVDGRRSKKRKRVGWRLDPRIPKEMQIIKECYGNPPRFSRGHMTRREDPVWGADEDASKGNADSMCVTNATPQMQSFNSPIWLALEDHALDHAREDQMKICVITGPYFDRNDPTHFGVKIPVSFWKVIAFIHDITGELTATGYEMDQLDHLPTDNEFVFGDFVSPQLGITVQTSIAEIERKSGLSFGDLAQRDPLNDIAENAGRAPQMRIDQIDQIVF